MGWMTRFEPATSGSTDRRSNQLSYIHHKSSIVIILIFGRFCQKTFRRAFANPAEPTNNLLSNLPPGTKIRPGHAISSGHTHSIGRAFRKATPIPPGACFSQGRATPQVHKHCPGQAFHRVSQFKQARKSSQAFTGHAFRKATQI